MRTIIGNRQTTDQNNSAISCAVMNQMCKLNTIHRITITAYYLLVKILQVRGNSHLTNRRRWQVNDDNDYSTAYVLLALVTCVG